MLLKVYHHSHQLNIENGIGDYQEVLLGCQRNQRDLPVVALFVVWNILLLKVTDRYIKKLMMRELSPPIHSDMNMLNRAFHKNANSSRNL